MHLRRDPGGFDVFQHETKRSVTREARTLGGPSSCSGWRAKFRSTMNIYTLFIFGLRLLLYRITVPCLKTSSSARALSLTLS